jgi:hypothetical protein
MNQQTDQTSRDSDHAAPIPSASTIAPARTRAAAWLSACARELFGGVIMGALTVFLCCAIVMAGAAYAAGAPDPSTDPSGWLGAVYDAVTSRSWATLLGLALIPLVHVARRLGPDAIRGRIGGILLSVFIALAATIGPVLAAGGKADAGLIISALTAALAASGIWELLKDHIPAVNAAAAKARSTPDSGDVVITRDAE